MSTSMAPGSRFSIPPFTDEVEQPENNDQLVQVASASAQVAVQGVIPFMQSDVVYGWVMEVSQTSTETDGTSTVTLSPYSPFIILGPLLLNMQYQYPSISVATGFDLALVNGYRPIVPNNRGLSHFAALATAPPFSDAPSSQVSQLFKNYTHNTGVSQTANFVVELPASTWFDSYYELDETGAPLSGPHNGFVSPQNMGGYARVITPSLRLNQLLGIASGTFDQQVYFGTAGSGAMSGSLNTTFGFSRIGVLGSLDSSVLPQPTNWQYNIAHQQISLSGVSTKQIPLNGIFAGQIMSICMRFFDPSVANGGAAINVTSIADILLQYGGSVVRWHGAQGNSVQRVQRRFAEQHLYIPAPGVVIIDLAMDRQGMVTNSYCLNTLRTAAVQINLTFTGALSATAYVEVTIDGLRWVPLPVNPNQ